MIDSVKSERERDENDVPRTSYTRGANYSHAARPTLVGVFAMRLWHRRRTGGGLRLVQQGYCEQPKCQAYMQKHCPEFCGAGAAAQADGANEDEENCQSWADDGYCMHEQYREYMEQSCRNACGFGPVSGDGQANDEAAVYYNEGEASEESLDGEDSVVAGNDASTAETRASGASSMAEESEHCAGWARQGLCEAGSAHYDYMKANCAFTCDDYAKGGGSGAYKYDPIACARWAMSGLCEDGNSHVAFMKQNCPSECEAALNFDPDAGKPPPADFWLILIVGGFGRSRTTCSSRLLPPMLRRTAQSHRRRSGAALPPKRLAQASRIARRWACTSGAPSEQENVVTRHD